MSQKGMMKGLSSLTICIVVAAVVVVGYIIYKRNKEGFSGAFDPSTRYSVAGIGPFYSSYYSTYPEHKILEENCDSCA